MALPEWTEKDVLGWASAPELHNRYRYVLFYTPMCGTCKAGARMLEVVSAMNPEFMIGMTDINLCRELHQAWQIESIPCLIELEWGKPVRRRYRMEGVGSLVEWIAKRGTA